MRNDFRTKSRWKSGSMYLIIMTPTGVPLFHGDDPTVENRPLIDIKDELGRPVGQELLAAAKRGDFVEYRWDGVDRVAYAVQYISGFTGQTLVVVGGFAQDLTSIPVEITPLPRPEVTAAEVVDRETLKTFVEGATEVYQRAMESPGLSELAEYKKRPSPGGRRLEIGRDLCLRGQHRRVHALPRSLPGSVRGSPVRRHRPPGRERRRIHPGGAGGRRGGRRLRRIYVRQPGSGGRRGVRFTKGLLRHRLPVARTGHGLRGRLRLLSQRITPEPSFLGKATTQLAP